MVARSKADADTAEPTPAPEADGSKSATIADVRQILHDELSAFFDGVKPEEPAAEPAKPEKELSLRETQVEMREIVSEAIKQLKAAEPPQSQEPEGKTEKAEAEIPPPVKKRRVESIWS